MITIGFTQDEYDTMFESVSDYILRSQEQIRALQGYQDKQNYWINELSLASDLMDKLNRLEDER